MAVQVAARTGIRFGPARRNAARSGRHAIPRWSGRSTGRARALRAWRWSSARTCFAPDGAQRPGRCRSTAISIRDGVRQESRRRSGSRHPFAPRRKSPRSHCGSRFSTTCSIWIRSPWAMGRPSGNIGCDLDAARIRIRPRERQRVLDHRADFEARDMRTAAPQELAHPPHHAARMIDLGNGIGDVAAGARQVGRGPLDQMLCRARQRARGRHRLIDLMRQRRCHAADET